MESIDEYTIDKILSFDEYGSIALILALHLKSAYIKKYSNIINTEEKKNNNELMSPFLFICLWRLEHLVKSSLYKIDQNILDNLPKAIWENISCNSHLRESFIIKNAHHLNLAKVKYFKKGQFSDKFYAAFPCLNICTDCFKHDTIANLPLIKNYHDQKTSIRFHRICLTCSKNICKKCDYVEHLLTYDEYGHCFSCVGCNYENWNYLNDIKYLY